MPLFLGLPKMEIIIVENLKDILYHDNILSKLVKKKLHYIKMIASSCKV